MKTLNTIKIPALFVLFFAVTNISFAQTTADVSAEVIAPADVTLLDDVQFGQIQQGATPTINPNTGDGTGVIDAVQVGRFSVDAGSAAETDLILNFDETVAIEGPGADITFTSNLVGDADEANQATAATRSTGDQVTSSAAGEFFIWLGGTLGTIPISQEPGAYSGTFTITVTFP